MGRSETCNYEASSDARFASGARSGPEPAKTSGGPSPSTSAQLESTDHTPRQPTGAGTHPKTFESAHPTRTWTPAFDAEESPSSANMQRKGDRERERRAHTPSTPEGTTTPETPPLGAGTSSLSSTPDLGFHLGEPTPEVLLEKGEPEGPTFPRLKHGRRTSGMQMPGLALLMEK